MFLNRITYGAVVFCTIATQTTASILLVNNYCTEQLWVTAFAPNEFGSSWPLNSGEAFEHPIEGKGNSVGITKTDGFYADNPKTPKLMLGYTTEEDRLWWSLYAQDGEPFDGKTVNVTSPSKTSTNSCGEAVGYEGVNHNCKDDGVTLTLNLCFY